MLAKGRNRLLAGLLTIVMVLGLLPAGAFAQESSGTVVYEKEAWTYAADQRVAHRKTIEKTGENQFEITLDVKTVEEIREQVISPDAAVVLVMDVSNSMKETLDGKEPDKEEQQRIYQAKAAARNFIDDFAAGAGDAQRKVALVEFGSSAYTVQGWTDPASAKSAVDNVSINFPYPACTIEGSHTHDVNTIEWGGFFGLQWRCSVPGCPYYVNKSWWEGGELAWYTLFNRGYEGHTHQQTFDGPHGDVMTDGGGTNIEGGLQLADNLLGSGEVADIGNRYVVLITDGVPTYHTYKSRDNSSLTFVEGQQGGGNYAQKADYENVPNVANAIKEDATLYTVSYASDRVKDTVGNLSIDAWLSTFANKNVAAGDNIDFGLGQISSIIQNQAKAWILTDPIPGENFIVFDPADNPNIPDASVNPDNVLTYDSAKKELTWNLKGEMPVKSQAEDGATWHYYQAKYTVRLDTADPSFVEDQPYETNGTTTLSYMVTENGVLQSDLKTTDLVVPKVSGKTPVVDYTIQYLYYDREQGKYVEGKTVPGSGKLWSKINVDQTAFEKPNYQFTDGPYGEQTLTGDGMVFTLKYDPIKVNVIVNHYGSQAVNTNEGTVTTVPSLVKRDPFTNGEYCQGDKFTLPEENLLPAPYELKASVTAKDGRTYTSGDYTDVSLTGNLTIDLYYVQTDEQRDMVDYTFNYYYRQDSWVLDEDLGTYVLTEGAEQLDPSKTVTNRDYVRESVTAPDLEAGSATWTLDRVEPGWTLDLKADSSENVINVYYYNTPAAPQAEEATLTIVHKFYDKTIAGETLVDTVYEMGSEQGGEQVYAGETYRAHSMAGSGYEMTTPAAQLTKTMVKGDNVIEVKYVKDLRVAADVEINHYYITYTWQVDESGEAKYVEDTSKYKEVLGVRPTGTWYVGQAYTAEQRPGGYQLNQEDSDWEARELAEGENVFDLYYESYVGEGQKADVTVNHIYETYSSYVDGDGNVILNERGQKTESDPKVEGYVGEFFTASIQEKDGFRFVSSDTPDQKVTLQGENGQYNIYYRAEDNQLGEPVSVTVQPIYKTYIPYINASGKPDVQVQRELGEPVEVAGDQYVGQKVSVSAGDYCGKSGYAFDAQDQENTTGLTIRVADDESENVIQVVYSYREDRGVPSVVLVKNVYTTVTTYVDENGAVQTKTGGFESANTTYLAYKGDVFDTAGKETPISGYQLDAGKTQPEAQIAITEAGGEYQVTFYWIAEDDQTVPATVQVVHHYTYTDRNPDVGTSSWTVGEDENLPGTFYAGQYFVASYDFQNQFAAQDVAEVLPSGATGGKGVKLAAGENVIHIYYEKTVDTRVNTTVTVCHNYYYDEAALLAGATEASYQETLDVRETDAFTAQLRGENAGLDYAFHSAEPAGYTIKVSADAAKNVITIHYVRAGTAYTVVHEYYTDGALTGQAREKLGGKAGDVVAAADLTKRPEYEGNAYTFDAGQSDVSITLASDPDFNGIFLRYYRTTGGGSSEADYYRVTVNYLDQDSGEQIADSYVSQRIREGRGYDVRDYDAIHISGYTYVETTGDATQGYMTGNKVVNVLYAAESEIVDPNVPEGPGPGTDIPDPEIPGGSEPGDGAGTGTGTGAGAGDGAGSEVEIPDGGIPQGNLPQTGFVAAPVDPGVTAGLLALAASMMGAGLYFTIGRKKEEE